jgi:hypothetical protein
MKSRLSSATACYDSVQNRVFPSPIQICERETHKTITLPAILYDCGAWYLRGPFEKFVDSLYCSESGGTCGGAVTVSFSKSLPLQAMHFLKRSIHFSKKCRRHVFIA